MGDLPAYIPEAVKSEYDRFLNWYFGGSPDYQACFVRLIERPCMEKVWRALERHLTSPTAWEWFIDRAVQNSDLSEWLDTHVRPEQKEVPRKLAQLRKAGDDLVAALEWLWGRSEKKHGYYPPDDWGDLLNILTADRMGVDGKRLQGLLYDRTEFPSEAPLGEYPKKVRMALGRYTVGKVIRAVVDMHSEWQPGNTGGEWEETRRSRKTKGSQYTQGNNIKGSPRSQLYAWAMARDLKKYCEDQPTIFPALESLPEGRLLGPDELARLTRAALDLPDKGRPNMKPFNARDVSAALKGTGD